MINIVEFLLGKNNKIVMPKYGCKLEEIVNWVKRFGIKNKFLKNEKVFYTIGKCKDNKSTEVAIWVIKHISENEDDFVWLGVALRPLCDKEESVIFNNLDKYKNYGKDIDFDDAIIIAKLMMESNNVDEIVEILQNYRENIN